MLVQGFFHTFLTRVTMGVMNSRFLALMLAACLLVSLPAADAMAQPASAAKKKRKKCKAGYKLTTVKKGKKKVKVCRKSTNNNGGGGGGGGTGGGGTTTDPKTAAQALIAGQAFYRPFVATNGGDYSGEELWNFCPDGRYFRRYTYNGSVSFYEYHDSGTWTLSDAKAGTAPNGVAGYDAVLALNGTYDEQPANGNVEALVSAQTTQSAINAKSGFLEYSRSAAQGC
jgi:hypothetical protein